MLYIFSIFLKIIIEHDCRHAKYIVCWYFCFWHFFATGIQKNGSRSRIQNNTNPDNISKKTDSGSKAIRARIFGPKKFLSANSAFIVGIYNIHQDTMVLLRLKSTLIHVLKNRLKGELCGVPLHPYLGCKMIFLEPKSKYMTNFVWL